MQDISDKEWLPTYLKNPDKEHNNNLKEFRCVEDNGELDQTYYFRFKLPMISERDLVCKLSVERKEGNAMFSKMYSVDHKDLPVYPNIIRNYQNMSALTWPHATIPNCWEICEVTQLDMKGHFPARLQNMILASSFRTEREKMH